MVRNHINIKYVGMDAKAFVEKLNVHYINMNYRRPINLIFPELVFDGLGAFR